MILRETIEVQVGEKDWQGDYEWSTWATNVPASLTPINSIETDNSSGIVTRYLLVTTVDLHSAPASGPNMIVLFRGKELEFQAGIERHTVDGRFSHCEAVVEDPYA